MTGANMAHKVSLNQRLYKAIKSEILSGAFLPGQSIPAAMLARRLSVSIIPVRDALHRLAGERLVEMWEHGGFHAPHMSEAKLRDLYQAQLGMLLWALDQPTMPQAMNTAPESETSGTQPLAAIEALFTHLAHFSGSHELLWALPNILDRLHIVSRIKPLVADDWADEGERLLAHWRHGDLAVFRRAQLAYHQHRITLVPGLVERVHLTRTSL
jgi:DNA-binding FadR family transcriptional regulator